MAKKQLIMEKSLELFANKGFEATSVQQITDYCGISKGAFYLSFKSKDELILALIDHFMMQFTADVDYVVTHVEDDEKLFYEFYYSTFNSFRKHSDFAKVLMKEQSQSFNKEFIVKMQSYDRLFEKTILSMVERLYGEEIEQIKYDLVYCIKGFISIYSQLFLFQQIPMDLDLLSKSLVEKTNVLAKHTTIPFISQELIQMVEHPSNEEVTKEKILELMEQSIEEMEESIEKESVILLKQQLQEPTLSTAIVKGLLKNIRNHPHCKWISYLLRNYFGF
ncbi:TetR/AcrR family transcriptional regulator [Paenisporosarcina indica]|uniref:TetR/AcrR family transcriptional regulator n=1 Tax=Paenisporosarcina indica TaxID=650093 RepID=UPI00094FF550|nr:TetR/AcrR family transcriptional regulator [Paenisporosarcina indica]